MIQQSFSSPFLSNFRRKIRRRLPNANYSPLRRLKTLLLVSVWCGVFTLLSFRHHRHHEQQHHHHHHWSKVHEEVEKWHLDDEDGVVPVLFKEWRITYPDEALFEWSEPPDDDPVDDDEASPGHSGRPVQLSPAQEKEAKVKLSKHQLNVVASDLIPLNRSLPDYRNDKYVTDAAAVFIHNYTRIACTPSLTYFLSRRITLPGVWSSDFPGVFRRRRSSWYSTTRRDRRYFAPSHPSSGDRRDDFCGKSF